MTRSRGGLGLALLLWLSPLAPPATATTAEYAVPAVQAVSSRAEVVGVTDVGERLTDLSVRSPALGNRVVKVRLLTPDGWNPADRRQHWPTFWLLAGCCGDYTAWSGTDIAKIDSLRKVLVVMPEAGWNGWYSNWWNHGAGGDPGLGDLPHCRTAAAARARLGRQQQPRRRGPVDGRSRLPPVRRPPPRHVPRSGGVLRICAPATERRVGQPHHGLLRRPGR